MISRLATLRREGLAGNLKRLLRREVGANDLSDTVRKMGKAQNAASSSLTEGLGLSRSGSRVEDILGQTVSRIDGVDDAVMHTNNAIGAAKRQQHLGTVGGQMRRAVGLGGLGFGASAGVSGFQDKFGDQLSDGGNFVLGAASVGLNVAGGLTAATHIGRAGLLATQGFKGAAASSSVGLHNKLNTSAQRLKHSQAKLKTSFRKYNKEVDKTADNFRMHSPEIRGARLEERQVNSQINRLKAGNSRRSTGGINRAGHTGGQKTQAMANFAKHRGGYGKMSGRKGNRTKRDIGKVHDDVVQNFDRYGGTGSISYTKKRLNHIDRQQQRGRRAIDKARGRGRDFHKTNREADRAREASVKSRQAVKSNKKALDRFDAYNQVKDFSASKLMLGAFKAPVSMGANMLGRGSLFGKIDPHTAFTGSAMAGGLLLGAGAGAGVGIASMKTLNLGRTQGPIQRPAGRSFSNISYNATLHSHRMNR